MDSSQTNQGAIPTPNNNPSVEPISVSSPPENSSPSLLRRNPLITRFIGIFAGLIVIIVLGIFIYQNYPFGQAAKASKEFYTGYLVKASQAKCDKNNQRCFRLLDSTGKVILFISPDGIKVRKSALMAMLGQLVRIKGIKIDKPPEPLRVIATQMESSSGEASKQGLIRKALMGLGGYSPADSPYTREAGTNSKSTSLYWRNIEPTMGTFNWGGGTTGAEREIQLCNDLNIPCNIMIGVAPAWAVTKSSQSLLANYQPKDKTPSNADWYCPEAPINMNNPSDANDNVVKQHFVDFVKKAAERYDGDGIDDAKGSNGRPLTVQSFLMYNEMDYYERNCGQAPWNTKHPEDDGKPFEGRRDGDLNKNGKPDWQDYADLQKDFYYAVKEVNPNLKVNFGTYGNFEILDQHYNGDEKTFLYKVLAHLQRTYSSSDAKFAQSFPYFDVMNAHYYEVYHCNTPFQEHDEYSVGGVRGEISWMKNIFAKFSKEGKLLERPFVLSEISDPYPFSAGSHQEEVMAINLWKIFAQSFSTGAEEVRWYDLGFGDPQFGLLEVKKKPDLPRKRPAFGAYQRLFNNLNGYGFHSIDFSNYDNLEGYLFVPVSASSTSNKIKTGNLANQPSSIINNSKEILWSIPTRPDFCSLKGSNWGNVREPVPAPPTIQKRFVATSIHTEDPFGKSQDITDGKTGDLDARRDGKITINISSAPLIVTVKN